jgi:translation elongation factor EF-Ts
MEKNAQLPAGLVNGIYRILLNHSHANRTAAAEEIAQYVVEEYATKLQELQQENAELRRWKMEAAELLTKIHSYAHKHLEIKLGESTVEFVIERAKERDEFKRQNDKLKEQAEGWRPLLEKVLVMNEMWGDLPGEFINEVKKFLYGE